MAESGLEESRPPGLRTRRAALLRKGADQRPAGIEVAHSSSVVFQVRTATAVIEITSRPLPMTAGISFGVKETTRPTGSRTAGHQPRKRARHAAISSRS